MSEIKLLDDEYLRMTISEHFNIDNGELGFWPNLADLMKFARKIIHAAVEQDRAGREAIAVDYIRRKADFYAKEFGHDDMGCLSFGSGRHAEDKLDYYNNLLELAGEIERLNVAPPAEQQAQEER